MEALSILLEARGPVNDWRIKDNTARPHSALSYLSPTEYARAWTIHSTARRRPIP